MTRSLNLTAGVAVLALAAGFAFYSYTVGRADGMSKVQALWDADKVATLEAHSLELAKAQATAAELNARIQNQTREHRNEITRISRSHAATVDSLRNRPEARAGAGGVPDTANSGAGCTGEGLAKRDAEFLARYSADAARLQSALNACQAAYDLVRESLIR